MRKPVHFINKRLSIQHTYDKTTASLRSYTIEGYGYTVDFDNRSEQFDANIVTYDDNNVKVGRRTWSSLH